MQQRVASFNSDLISDRLTIEWEWSRVENCLAAQQ